MSSRRSYVSYRALPQSARYVTAKQLDSVAKKAAKEAVAAVKKAPVKKTVTKKAAASPKASSHKKKRHAEVGHHEERVRTHANTGVGRHIGKMAGSMIPVVGPIAEQALGWLGDKLEDGIGSLFGFGEYKVENNSLMDGGGNVIPEGGRPPMVSNAFEHDGSAVVIKHQEPLGDIITSAVAGEFKLQNFFIQPGLASSFPWLASMAQNFQQYRILGMLFEFRSMAADAISGTNIALGTVTMATNYNAGADNFLSKKDMQNSEYATSTKPSLSVFHPIECDPKVSAEEVLYIRNAAVPDGDDQRLYDWGNFQIATSGFQGTSVTIGELWVTYEVALIKPKAVSTTGSYILATHMLSNSSAGVTNTTPLAGATAWSGGTLNAYVGSGGNSLYLDVASGLQVGQIFKMDFYFAGSSTGGISNPTVATSGMTMLNRFNNTLGTNSTNPQNSATTVQRCCWSFVVRIDSVATDPSITFTVATLPAGTVTSDIYVIQCPSTF